MSAYIGTCRRCGIDNIVRSSERNSYLCASCKVWETDGSRRCRRCWKRCRADNGHPNLCGHCAREPEHLIELTGGQWVRDGLVQRWVPDPPMERQPRVLQPCGTRAAYKRHKRAGETPCEPCRKAAQKYRDELARRARRNNWKVA